MKTKTMFFLLRSVLCAANIIPLRNCALVLPASMMLVTSSLQASDRWSQIVFPDVGVYYRYRSFQDRRGEFYTFQVGNARNSQSILVDFFILDASGRVIFENHDNPIGPNRNVDIQVGILPTQNWRVIIRQKDAGSSPPPDESYLGGF